MVSDGTFLERVREKYGDDVLIKKDQGSEEESNSYDSEVDHSSSESAGSEEDVGPRFEKKKHEPAEKVEELKEVGPIKITKKRMMPATFIPEKQVEKEE